jgi:hypothetical protein
MKNKNIEIKKLKNNRELHTILREDGTRYIQIFYKDGRHYRKNGPYKIFFDKYDGSITEVVYKVDNEDITIFVIA